jgi:dTMP kinase
MAKFITFEGMEGSGKSTQVNLLKEYLLSKGVEVITTREPGGTALAEQIRHLLLNDCGITDVMTEFLLLSAARRDHVENLIKPSLAQGKWVICDRFYDSSLVYQGMVKNLDQQVIEKITELTLGKFKPDITFLLDIEPQTALARLDKRRAASNHYDTKGIEFHAAIRQGFLSLSKQEPHRIKVINAANTSCNTSKDIINNLS